MKKWIAPLAVSGFSILLSFGLLEGVARFYYARFGNPVDQVSPILRPDPALQWRQREGVKTTLWDVPIHLDERGFRGDGWRKGPENILTLGPSSAFGWGVAGADSYPALLAAARSRAGRPTENWNASQIGFSSAQGVRLAEQLDPGKFSWAVIGYGINDLDRFRFFGPSGPTDAEVFSSPVASFPAWSYRSRLFYALLQIVGKIKQQTQCGITVFPQERVSEAQFLGNFEALAGWAHARGARPIFVTTPFRPGSASLVGEGDAEALYRQSVVAAARQECQQAREAFVAARQAEPRRLVAEVKKRNAALRAWAEKNQYILVDAAALLTTDADFVDPVHFSARGNHILAEALSMAIAAAPAPK